MAGTRLRAESRRVALSRRAGAVGIDLVDAAAGQRGQLLDDRPVDQDAQTRAAHRAVLQRAAVDHDLGRVVLLPSRAAASGT